MSTSTIRMAGVGVILGAAVFVISQLLSAFLFVGGNGFGSSALNPAYVPLYLVYAIAFVPLLFSFPVIYLRWTEAWGAIGLIGLILLFSVGLLFGVFFGFLQAVFFPYLARHDPGALGNNGPTSFFVFFIVGSALQVIATVLIGVQVLRGRLPGSRWFGLLWLLAAVATAVGFLGPSSNTVGSNLLSDANGTLVGVGLIVLGYQLWSSAPAKAPDVTRPEAGETPDAGEMPARSLLNKAGSGPGGIGDN